MQERFNWNNFSPKKPTELKKSFDIKPVIEIKKDKGYGYVVDMTEKPQDPGSVN